LAPSTHACLRCGPSSVVLLSLHLRLLVSFRSRPPPTPPLFPYTTLFRSPHCSYPCRITCDSEVRHMVICSARHDLFRHDLANRRSEEHTSELQSRFDLVCRLLLEKKSSDNITNSST